MTQRGSALYSPRPQLCSWVPSHTLAHCSSPLQPSPSLSPVASTKHQALSTETMTQTCSLLLLQLQHPTGQTRVLLAAEALDVAKDTKRRRHHKEAQ